MDLVTVIIPVYNVEDYLEECVMSILNQKYTTVEVILVDDGSKDNSGNICDNLALIDKRIKVIHKKNEGLGYARNSGLRIANGKYVTFIDSDDIAEDDLIQNLVDGIRESKADTCIGGYKRIDVKGDILYIEEYKEKLYLGNEVYKKFFIRMLGSQPNIHDAIRMSVWNAMYSMDIIRDNKIKFPSEREFISEDIIWDSEYYKYSKAVKVIESSSYCYRVTPGSLTQKYKKDKFTMVCRLYVEMEKRIDNKMLYKEGITRLQRQFFVNLRSCISQERLVCKNFLDMRRKIKEICNQEVVGKVINTYPINEINFKARIFLLIIKLRCYSILSILTKCKFI